MTFLLILRLVIVLLVLVIPGYMEENNLEHIPRTPHFRSATARTLYSKMLIDERLRRMDWRQEYLVGEALPSEVLRLFVPLSPDVDSTAFVRHCQEGGWGVGGVLLTEVVRGLLTLFLHQTTVNGLLNRGRMFVWSREQAAVLLSREQHSEEHSEGDHLVQEQKSSVLRGENSVLQDHDVLAGEHCSSAADRTRRTGDREQLDVCYARTLEEQCSRKNTVQPDIAPVHREHRVHSQENSVLENSRTVREQQENTVQLEHNNIPGVKKTVHEHVQAEHVETEHVLDEEQFYDATDSSFLIPEEQENTEHTEHPVLHVHREQQQKKRPWEGLRVLDVGAGDGHVTEVLTDSAASVSVTEISAVMRLRLRQRGYRVLDAHNWPDNDNETYDLITCLNVLDRHRRPLQLLQDIGGRLEDGGRLVLALVLPFAPFVEYDSTSHEPEEELGITGRSFEEQVTSLIQTVLPRHGYRVERWSKVPYMCEGDLEQSIYWLQDAILVCSKL